MVTVPKSVCGPIRNWPGSGAPATAIGGYQLMFMVCVTCAVCRVKKSGARPSAAAHSMSSSSASPQVLRCAVAADQEEAHALQRGVHLGGDGHAGRLVSAEPGPQV